MPLRRSPATRTALPPAADARVDRWIRRELADATPRAPSLIITVWGDSIAPHGGAALLPGLIHLLEPFGINERLTRTSVFRLSRDGWLKSTAIGRRSLYRLTADGARRFDDAHRRIYSPPADDWNGSWELVFADEVAGAQRRALRDELRWAGFGAIGPATWLAPLHEKRALPRIAKALGVEACLVVTTAHDDAVLGGRPLASVLPQAWDVEGIAAGYRRFLRRFGTVIERFRRNGERGCDPEQSFIVRTLLIHAYRRVLLRDPQLPVALLPLDWPGGAAYALCRDFYRLTHRAAERHLKSVLEGAHGTLPPANAAFYRRFGGLVLK